MFGSFRPYSADLAIVYLTCLNSRYSIQYSILPLHVRPLTCYTSRSQCTRSCPSRACPRSNPSRSFTSTEISAGNGATSSPHHRGSARKAAAKRAPGLTGIDRPRGHHGEHMKNEVGVSGRALVEVRLLPWSAAFSARSAVRREGIEAYRDPEVGKDNGEGIAYRFPP